MKDLIIIGASGFGREVAWLVERINEKEPTWNLMGFVDDNADIQGTLINGYPVLGTTSDIGNFDAYYVCAIGSSKIRMAVIDRIKAQSTDVKFATLIDPSVEMSRFVTVGEGSIICAHSLLTVNIDIGRHVIINLDCTIGHDAKINDFSTLYPSVNISGNDVIGECCEIGTGAKVIQGLKLGDGCIVGAGAVVVNTLNTFGTYVGVPAELI